MSPARWVAAAVALATTQLLACEPVFPVPSRLETVRVLGAVVDKPLSQPGETVNVQLLVHDGGAPLDAPRPLSIAWFGGCHDPADDAPGSCYAALSWISRSSAEELLAKSAISPGMPSGATLAYGPEANVIVPTDIVTAHRPLAGEIAPRGISYLYFAVCQGDLVPFVGERSPVGIPIDCVDTTTRARVGPSRFVSGYVTLRADPVYRNDNPVLGGLRIAGKIASHAPCVGDGGCAEGEGCGAEGTCLAVVAACSKSDVVDCPSVRLLPEIAETSFQPDETAGLDPPPPESLWMAYFATAGELDGDVRIVVDPSSGRAVPEAYAGEWKVQPGFRGQARLFAVAHDNRGGAAFVKEDVLVR